MADNVSVQPKMIKRMPAANSKLAKIKKATAQPNPMQRLYARLSGAGFTRSFVKKHILPSWWDDDAAANPSGYSEALLLLSRHLGLNLASLQNNEGGISFSVTGTCKFKKSEKHSESDVELARSIAYRASVLATAATPSKLNVPATASDIRQTILNESRWVSLENLTNYCWSIGVPVLHISVFPPETKKPDGMAVMVNGRPAIVICKNQKSSAWLLFIIAHELGHIVLGHVQNNGVLVDDHISEESKDAEEIAANRFAIQILTGSAERKYLATGTWPDGPQLAHAARTIGHEQRVDPGHIVLNYAHSMNKSFFPVAQNALKILEPNANAPALIGKVMAEKLDWSQLPEDSNEFLMRITHSDQ